MPSPKRRTTSKSGNSARSTKREKSSRTKPSSGTVPDSFEAVFGTARQESEERRRARSSLADAKARLAAIEVGEPPKPTLLRVRRQQRMSRLRSHIRNLEEYLATELLEQ